MHLEPHLIPANFNPTVLNRKVINPKYALVVYKKKSKINQDMAHLEPLPISDLLSPKARDASPSFFCNKKPPFFFWGGVLPWVVVNMAICW